MSQYIYEIYEVIAECEEPEIIDHTADKILEFAGKDKEKVIKYLEENMNDNPLYERIIQNNNLH